MAGFSCTGAVEAWIAHAGDQPWLALSAPVPRSPTTPARSVLVARLAGRRRPLLVGVVGVRGDLAAVLGQHPADRLDPEPVPVSVDEGDYLCDWRSSSAPKKCAAALRISFARRSSFTSRSSSFIRARSSLVNPGRCPASVSALRTHCRKRLVIHVQLLRRSTRSPSTASGTRPGAQTPSEPPAPGTPAGYGGRGALFCSDTAPSSQRSEQSPIPGRFSLAGRRPGLGPGRSPRAYTWSAAAAGRESTGRPSRRIWPALGSPWLTRACAATPDGWCGVCPFCAGRLPVRLVRPPARLCPGREAGGAVPLWA